MAFISISIDLAGSTALKSDILEISKEDPENTQDLYRMIARLLYLRETAFYFQAIHNGLDINRFFVVKTIGDEIWIIYDIDGIALRTPEFNVSCHGIIESLLTITEMPTSISITSRRFTPEEENDPELQLRSEVRVEQRHFALKAFVDIVDSFEDASQTRYDTLQGRFESLFPTGFDFTKLDPDQKKSLINRLNIGFVADRGNAKWDISYRTDPIGFEVDHFFRCSKTAKPCLVTCGSKLIDQILFEKPWSKEKQMLTQNCQLPYGDERRTSYTYYDVIWENLQAKHLKGIGEEYLVCHLFRHPMRVESAIRGEFERIGTADGFFGETISLFLNAGVLGK